MNREYLHEGMVGCVKVLVTSGGNLRLVTPFITDTHMGCGMNLEQAERLIDNLIEMREIMKSRQQKTS